LEEFYYFQQMERGPQWGYMLQHLAGQFLPWYQHRGPVRKAFQLCQKNKVEIHYQVVVIWSVSNYKVDQNLMQLFIYAHFPAAIKSAHHKILELPLVKVASLLLKLAKAIWLCVKMKR
jgi:hypothetical protein